MRGTNDPVAVAALALAAAVLAVSVPFDRGTPPPCEDPRQADGLRDHTRTVLCRPGDAVARLRGPARLLFGLRLDLNCADAASLEVLPGIGPGRAAAIVRSRCERPFASLSDLTRIRGIGPRTLERLAGWAEVRTSSNKAALCGRSCP